MSRTVWKYPLEVTDLQTVTMPVGARILAVQAQGERLATPALWALVDPEMPHMKVRQFRILGTGHPADDSLDNAEYRGTFQLLGGALVFHVFEVDR